MDQYMDFHLVNNILHLHEGKFKPVPLSKGKIFESKELSLLEKKTLLMSLHKLIKIYHRFMKVPEDHNSTK
jgi:RAB protein geranylgeranyltransferase component A